MLASIGVRTEIGSNTMTEAVSRLSRVEPILFGVCKLEWIDGFQAVVDLRAIIARAEIFQFLRDTPDRFAAVQMEAFGHFIYWLDDQGDEVELGSDALRERAVRQAEILRLAS